MAPTDDYKLLKNGNIELLKRQRTKPISYMRPTKKGNVKENKPVIVEKGILDKPANGKVLDGKKTYNVSIYSLKGEKASENLFKFVANNSNVEWGLNQFADGNNYFTTGYWPTGEPGATELFYHTGLNFNGRTLLNSDHSHPGGIHYPSGQGTQGGDKNWAWQLQQRFLNIL